MTISTELKASEPIQLAAKQAWRDYANVAFVVPGSIVDEILIDTWLNHCEAWLREATKGNRG